MRIVIALLLCPIIASALGPMRTFTGANGRKILASFVAARGDTVIIQTTDGHQHVLKTASLSPADQEYVVTRGGKVGEVPGASPRPAPPSRAPAQEGGNGNYGGMALAPDWMPQRTETKRELLRSLAFYAKAVLEDAPPGKETVPGRLSDGFSWLMPVDQAIAALPRGAFKLGERKVEYTCFPANSLTLVSYGCNNFVDQGKTFNVLHLLLDAKRRVVSVEFVEQTPKKGLVYEEEGVMEPYYNFLTLTNNASTKKEVIYALKKTSPGVMMVQTVFRDKGYGGGGALMPGMPQLPGMPGGPGMRPDVARMPQNPSMFPGKVYEYVHWYLPAPLARCLLQIAEKNGVQAQ